MKNLLKNVDFQHLFLFFGAPVLTAFVDSWLQSESPLSKHALEQAAVAAVAVGFALAKKSFLGQLPAASGDSK